MLEVGLRKVSHQRRQPLAVSKVPGEGAIPQREKEVPQQPERQAELAESLVPVALRSWGSCSSHDWPDHRTPDSVSRHVSPVDFVTEVKGHGNGSALGSFPRAVEILPLEERNVPVCVLEKKL